MSSSPAGTPSALPQIMLVLVYSLFTANTTRPSRSKRYMPSLLSPKARAWLSAVPRVASSNSGASAKSGSPHCTRIRVS